MAQRRRDRDSPSPEGQSRPNRGHWLRRRQNFIFQCCRSDKDFGNNRFLEPRPSAPVSRPMRKIRSLVLLVSAFALTYCTAYRAEPTRPVPTPPAKLLNLPQTARISCSSDSAQNSGDVVVCELPGVEPSDPNSAHQGRRGERLGTLSPCTPVTMTDYAWSETDQEFWVHITSEGLEGWVSLPLIDYAS